MLLSGRQRYIATHGLLPFEAELVHAGICVIEAIIMGRSCQQNLFSKHLTQAKEVNRSRRPNQSMERTAARCAFLFFVTRTHSLQFTLAPASGG
jgi:hypothetical protein